MPLPCEGCGEPTHTTGACGHFHCPDCTPDDNPGDPAPRLPPEFWGSRAALAAINDVAISRMISPDALLATVLATLASQAPHDLRFDLGGGPGCLVFYTGIVAKSGSGKTRNVMDLAGRFLPEPEYLVHRTEYDEECAPAWLAPFHLSTGQGLVEAFHGDRTVPDGPGAATKTVRAQVRHNLLAEVDEGHQMIGAMKARDSILGSTLRTMWSGRSTGQGNASRDLKRHLNAFTYSFGLIVGIQPTALPAMLAEAPLGTPQRFLWLSATKAIPDEAAIQRAYEDWKSRAGQPDEDLEIKTALTRWDPMDHPTGATIVADDLVALDVIRTLAVKGTDADAETDELRSQELLMRCKVAALLAILDDRLRVTAADWALAQQLVDMSRAVLAHAERAAELSAKVERLRAAEHRAEQQRVVDTSRNDVVERARKLRDKVRISPDGLTRRDLVKSVKFGPARDLVPAAIAFALANRFFEQRESDGRFVCTPSDDHDGR